MKQIPLKCSKQVTDSSQAVIYLFSWLCWKYHIPCVQCERHTAYFESIPSAHAGDFSITSRGVRAKIGRNFNILPRKIEHLSTDIFFFPVYIFRLWLLWCHLATCPHILVSTTMSLVKFAAAAAFYPPLYRIRTRAQRNRGKHVPIQPVIPSETIRV